MTIPYPPPLHDIHSLTEHLCLAERTIEELIRRGEFPEHWKIVGRKRMWRWRDIEKWMDEADDSRPSSNVENLREATRRVAQGR